MATRRRVHRLRSKSKRRLRGGEGGAFNRARENPLKPITPEELEGKRKEYIDLLTNWNIRTRVINAETPEELETIMNTELVPGCDNKYKYVDLNQSYSFVGTKAVIIKKLDAGIDAMKAQIAQKSSIPLMEGVIQQGFQQLCKTIPRLGIVDSVNARYAEEAYNRAVLHGIEDESELLESRRSRSESTISLNEAGDPEPPGNSRASSFAAIGGKHKKHIKHNNRTKRLKRRS